MFHNIVLLNKCSVYVYGMLEITCLMCRHPMRPHASSIEDPPRMAAEMKLVALIRDIRGVGFHVFCLLSLSASLMQYQYTGNFSKCQ